MMLKVDDIHVYYGQIHAIKGVSFEVHEGEIVSLIGANGAGKSTVLKTISGLMHPKSGSISFLGDPIAHTEAYKLVNRGLAQVPEGRRIFLQMTVRENLDMGAYTQKEVSDADIEDVFRRFPRLKEREKQIAGTLSGGEQQMLAMGRAMMSEPKLLMLDEPSLGLAPIIVEEVFDQIAKIRDTGVSILIIEQNLSAALSIAQRGYVLENGRVALEGSSDELQSNQEVKRAYLGI